MNNEIMDSKFARLSAILIVEDTLYSTIEREIDELEFYFLTLENLIDEEERKEVSLLESAATKWVPRWDEGDFWSENYPYWWKDVFATQLRFSFVVWAMAVLVHRLKSVCENCAILIGKEWKGAKDDKGLVQRARSFLVQAVRFVKPDKGLWEKLETTYQIRDYLVHHGIIAPKPQVNDTSRWAKDSRRIRPLIAKTNGIEIRNYQLAIAPDFCKSIVSIMKELFVQLHAEHIELCERVRGDAEREAFRARDV